MRQAVFGLFIVIAGAICARAGEIDTPQVLFAEPTTMDQIGCVAVAVYINGAGPYRFVVDTASNRTLLSPRLAQTLQISLAGAPMSMVNGINGAEPAPIVRLGELKMGLIVEHGLAVSVLANQIHPEADGLLGGEYLSGRRLLIDFKHNRVDISDGGSSHTTDYDVIATSMRFGQLPVVDAMVGHTRVLAIIDTGAERSIGNTALLQALAQRQERIELAGEVRMSGVVGSDFMTKVVQVPLVTVANLRLTHLPILFADPLLFELWGLDQRPAMVIGMDVLGQFDAIGIDYEDNLLLLRFPE
jgi:hypothetical protein